MNKNSRIYVAGHLGLVGRAVLKKLKEQGYRGLVLRTHEQLDLTDRGKTDKFFKESRPDYVLLLAAKTGGILANSKHPADFIYQNIQIESNVIHCAYKYRVKKLLFLGSACMYPKFCPIPIKEEYLLTGPIEPANEPFAIAKICGIKLCQAYKRQFKRNFICAVPATIYGPFDHFDNNGHVVAGLIQKFHQAKLARRNKIVEIWGTGRPKREFIFVDDAAEALIFLMNYYNGNEIVNIGTQKEMSIKELAETLKKIIGFKGTIRYEKEKPDGPLRRLLDSSKILKMGWKPRVPLFRGLELTYEWYGRQKPNKL